MKQLPFVQEELKTALPQVYACADYHALKAQLTLMDSLLRVGGLEADLVADALQRWERARSSDGASTKPTRQFLLAKSRKARYLRMAVRCNILRHLLGFSERDLSIRIADGALLQWFIGINFIDGVHPPSKSTLDRFSRDFAPEKIEQAVKDLMRQVGQPEGARRLLDVDDPLRMDKVFVDTTCVKLNIHFPVDWVLLRDAVRTLVASLIALRALGIKHRMPDPNALLRECNRLCMRITHSRRQKGGKKQRKKAFRVLKDLARTVGEHGERYMNELARHQTQVGLSAAEAAVIHKRMRNILDQLPAAIRQAHERIIGERQMPNEEKIFSLYEPNVHVLVRGKDGAEVEFGNGLLLVEQPDGLIVHWNFMRDQPPVDSKHIKPLIDTLAKTYGVISALATDRGFHSAANDQALQEADIFNAICPKSPDCMRERGQDTRFLDLQRRRGQTEGRIGIFKNVFLDGRLHSKGFDHQQLTVNWCVLTHNLWVLARIALAAAKKKRQAAA